MKASRVLFLLILVLFTWTQAFASKIDSLHTLTHIIKINMSAAIFNEINLSFEQRIKNSFWIGVNVGVVYAMNPVPTRNAPFVADGDGIVVRSYFKLDNLFTKINTFYASGLVMYKKISYDHVWTGYGGNGDTECTIESGIRNATGVRVLFGYVYPFGKFFLFDLFAGFGANYEINKIYIYNEGYGGDCHKDKSSVTKNRDSKRFVPTIHTGLNIGIGW